MAEKNVRLLGEIRKLITNVVFKEGGVYLPEIGEIRIEGDDTKSRSLSYAKGQTERSRSIVSVIAERGNCTEGQALTVYNRWLEQVKVGEVFEIEGIAMISENQFKASEELEEKLNPKVELTSTPTPKAQETQKAQATQEVSESPRKTQKDSETKETKEPKEPQKPKPTKKEPPKKAKKIAKKKRSKAPIWAAASIFVIAIIGVAISTLLETTPKQEAKQETPQTLPELSEERPVAPIEEPKQEEPKQEEPKQAQTKQAEPKPQVKRTQSAQPANKIVSKARYAERAKVIEAFERAIERGKEESMRFKVVSGVYSSQINAGRMALDIEYRVKGVDVAPSIYKRGDGYMVVIFESNWIKESSQFLNEVASKYYTTTWIFDQQRN